MKLYRKCDLKCFQKEYLASELTEANNRPKTARLQRSRQQLCEIAILLSAHWKKFSRLTGKSLFTIATRKNGQNECLCVAAGT